MSHRPSKRVQLAIAVGRVAAAASRRLTGGSGGVIGGSLAERIHPRLLVELGRGRVLACISATNGKTTTTRMLTVALGEISPISNSGGANLTAGLITALMSARDRPAVLEVDEMYLGMVIRAVAPQIVVLLNLSRDQLDRTTETRKLAAGWRQALACTSAATTVVANCDDPLVVWAAAAATRVVWVSAGQPWAGDTHACPACGGLLNHSRTGPAEPVPQQFDRLGTDWSCPRCGLSRPRADAALDGYDLVTSTGKRLPISVQLPGRANRANAVMATVAAGQLSVAPEQALARIHTIGDVAGRYAVQRVSTVRCRMLLAKNPASWLETLDILSETAPRPVVICLGAREVDGRDTSWLYDVVFERLRGKQITVSGRRAADLSLRLLYADVPHQMISDVEAAVRGAAASPGPLASSPAGSSFDINVIGDYSSFHEIQRLVATQLVATKITSAPVLTKLWLRR